MCVLKRCTSSIISLLFFLAFADPGFACLPDNVHDNPVKHRPFVGTSCVYYGAFGGYITEGPYKFFIISDDLLRGFEQIRSGRPDLAFTDWLTLASLGNLGAAYNVGVMLHRGLGTTPDWIAALDFLGQTMQGHSHFNTANAYTIRMLQEALIGLEFLDGRADGDYGPRTDAAVEDALASLGSKGPRPDHEYWHFYAIVDEFGRRGGWKSETAQAPTKPTSPPIASPSRIEAFVASPESVERPRSIVSTTTASTQGSLSPAELYRLRTNSVHMIFAADSLKRFQSFDDISQGSAVAVSEDTLVTNCHVIGSRQYIVFLSNGIPYPARRVAGSDERDTCLTGC